MQNLQICNGWGGEIILFSLHRFLHRLIPAPINHSMIPIKESIQNTEYGQLALTSLMTEF